VAAEEAAAPPEEDRWDSSPYMQKVDGKLTEFFFVGAVAMALDRSSNTIRRWIEHGTIPQARYRINAVSIKGSRRLWTRAQVDRAQPVTFETATVRPSVDRPGAVEVEVAATHRPSLDPIRGLVPGRSSSVWLVRKESDAWRVAADPVSFRPILPAEAAATDVVQRWVSRLAAFGPDVNVWGRLVPVSGPGNKFLAAVAPMGDGWQVMGVAVGGQ